MTEVGEMGKDAIVILNRLSKAKAWVKNYVRDALVGKLWYTLSKE